MADISDWSGLANMTTDGTHILVADLDRNTSDYETYAGSTANSNAGWAPINGFTGNFNGSGYTIANVYINMPSTDNVGLFGNGGQGGIIINLGVIDATVTGRDATGILVGGQYPNTEFIISGCYTTGVVAGNAEVGGLIGTHYFAEMVESYSQALVSGASTVGGLVGTHYASSLTNCYSTGEVQGGATLGGLIGNSVTSETINSFWDTETSGQASSAGGTGLTTGSMQTLLVFTTAGWDMVDISSYTSEVWFIDNGNDYPRLGWQYAEAPPAGSSLTILYNITDGMNYVVFEN